MDPHPPQRCTDSHHPVDETGRRFTKVRGRSLPSCMVRVIRIRKITIKQHSHAEVIIVCTVVHVVEGITPHLVTYSLGITVHLSECHAGRVHWASIRT